MTREQVGRPIATCRSITDAAKRNMNNKNAAAIDATQILEVDCAFPVHQSIRERTATMHGLLVPGQDLN